LDRVETRDRAHDLVARLLEQAKNQCDIPIPLSLFTSSVHFHVFEATEADTAISRICYRILASNHEPNTNFEEPCPLISTLRAQEVPIFDDDSKPEKVSKETPQGIGYSQPMSLGFACGAAAPSKLARGG